MLSGNHNFVVYRLCKYSSNNIQTFEIEDEDPIELSDEEDNIICLDSDGESVDIKEEYDLDIQLSRNFNMEIKKELEDLDEEEAISIKLKREPADSQPNESDHNMNEWFDYFNLPAEHVSEGIETTAPVSSMDVDPVSNEDDNSNHSTDSNQTVCFPTTPEQNNVKDLPQDCDTTSPLSDHTNIGTNKLKPRELELKLKEAVDKVIDSEKKKRKKGPPEMIYAKPLTKRRKSKGDESPPQIDKPKSKSTSDRKEKLKVVASTSPKRAVPEEEKPTASTHTTPKVKFTPNNRGSFLTDLTQMPLLPREIQQKQKVKENENNEVVRTPEKVKPSPEKVLLGTEPTPPELEQKILAKMYSHVTPPDSIRPPNEQSATCIERKNSVLPASLIENDDSGTESFTHDGDDENTNEVPDDDRDTNEVPDVEMNTNEIETNEESDENDDDDDDDDPEDIMYNILMKLPPETGTIHIIETYPKPVNIKSILKSSERVKNISTATRRVTFKETETLKKTGFQYDPRHKTISDLTAYDHTKYETVDAFCRCVDENISSFADSYEDYKEYRE